MEEEDRVVKEIIPIIDEINERGQNHCSLSRFWFFKTDVRLVARLLENIGYTCLVNDVEDDGGLEVWW